MVSLLKLSEITEDGVKFQSPFPPHDEMMLTPEHSIELQQAIGADIMMQLDDVVNPLSPPERIEEAMHRSIRWLDRCITQQKAVNTNTQNLFCIIQGGLNLELRKQCCAEMANRDTPGIAIGGLSGGECKDEFARVVACCTEILPINKPRYCMGIGYAEDLVMCCALGVDMYDCVYPTRTARFGKVLTMKGPQSIIKLSRAGSQEQQMIEADCKCSACNEWGIDKLALLFRAKDPLAMILLQTHNIAFQMRLMERIRNSIVADRFPQWIQSFMRGYFFDGGSGGFSYNQSDLSSSGYPRWIVDTLATFGIKLL